jgi:hypothetical protein
MKHLPIACLFFAGLCLPGGAYAENCSGLPTHFTGNEFPKGNFFSNFNNSCYLIPFASGNGSGGEQGDLNSLYNKLYFNSCPAGATKCINPNLPPYELIVLGQFPNSRYFSIAMYDNHSALIQNLSDVNLVPLTSNDINPYEPGVAFINGQHFGAAIHLGGTPGTLEKGCMMTGYNVEANGLDGTLRHPFINWNLDKPFLDPPNTNSLHEVDTPTHSNPNNAGVLIVRSYLDLTVPTAANQPHVIVRDVASGCAYPAAYVTGTMNVVSTKSTVGNTWQNQQQVNEHNVYANWQSTACWGSIPYTRIQWLRGDEYVPGANPDAAYLYAFVPAGLPQTLFTASEVMRIRFRVPATPPTPCVNGCSRAGNEQMRYLSVSFQIPGGGTLASLPDSCPLNPAIPCLPLIQDANGYVTLVVGTGIAQPAWVTPANGYTWLDLSNVGNSNYLQLNEIAIRNILPSSWFNCSTQMVPYKVGEATANAQDGPTGLMSLYAPLIDYPVASTLPATASPAMCGAAPCPSSCAVYPIGPPAVTGPLKQKCSVLLPSPITITALTTQCSIPGCNQVIAQPAPPISITGTGFGSFPLGLPYNGMSKYLEIIDTTQNWSAGYIGDPCSVSIGEWSDGLISVIANVNQNGGCPLAAGDQLTVKVQNPQTLSTATLTTTVVAPSGARPTK